MVNFTIDQVIEIMNKQDQVRNMSVIAHVDHGKSTLTDSLVAKAGIIAAENAGKTRFTDGRDDEKDRGITIKSTGVSLYYEYIGVGDENKKAYLFNLIDSPGHIDFSSEVTAALRVTDGALVVVDYVEGVAVQTETVVRQSLMELIKPVLMINKVDRAFFELKHNSETIYQNFIRVIENFNGIVSTYQKEDMMGNCEVDPLEGNVCMGSAYFGWAFTLHTFAKILTAKNNFKNIKSMTKKLWGDNFLESSDDEKEKTNNSNNENKKERYFCKYIMDPILKLNNAIIAGEKKLTAEYLEKIGVKLTSEELEFKEKDMVRAAMQHWINASEALFEMMIFHLPSPKVAQKYRTQYLYEGPLDDVCAKAMMDCDPEGPFMMFVSKMIPAPDGGRFYAFGRVFSGKATNQKVKIMGPNYKPGKKEDVFEKNIQRVVVMMGNKIEEVESVPCGNTCALIGVDSCIIKQATLSSESSSCIIKSMKYSVSPVVRIAVAPKNMSDLPKLIDGLQKMAKTDPLVQVTTGEKENVIAGCGELHLEICINDLQKIIGMEVIQSDPVVPYKESVLEKSNQTCMSKSANKHNRLYLEAEPLDSKLVEEIEDGNINPQLEIKVLSRRLIDEFNWEQNESKKVWTFGPENVGPNLLVDTTKQVQYLNEIRDHMNSSFQWVTKEGVIAEEPMRGIRFNILDVNLHPDAVHRGANQIVSAARCVYLGCQYTANPVFVEPVFLVDISAPNDVMGGVYTCLSQRRGVVFEEETIEGTPMVISKAYLPVAESFGFTKHLRTLTSGKAFPMTTFDHWEIVKGSPFEDTVPKNIMVNIRKRKGLKQEIPSLDSFLDKK